MKSIKIRSFILFLLAAFAVGFQVRFASAQDKSVQVVANSLELAKVAVGDKYFEDAYVALATENPSKCSYFWCRAKMEELLNWRYIGEGRCDLVTSQDKDNKRTLCWALKQGDCGLLSDSPYREGCRIIIEKDIKAVAALYLSLPPGPYVSMEKMAIAFGIAQGYRDQSEGSCQNYFDAYVSQIPPESAFFICRLVFSHNVQEARERVESELALFLLAEQDAKYCDKIINPTLGKACAARYRKE